MDFRLLGPIELRVAGRALPVGEPRQRLVLAALLVDVGRTIGADTLVTRVWGDRPPERARRALHAHLSRIRRALAQAAAVEIETTGGATAVQLIRASGGYSLVLDPDRVDLIRFRRLVARAREPGGSDAGRGAALAEALSLWRGEALAGLAGDWAERLRRSLEQDRVGALIAWADTEVRGGNATAVLGPLSGLVEENPLLEPATGVLMRALQAAGRSADALQQFARIRRRLRDELGTDPGAALQATHQNVLQGNHELPGSHEPAPVVRATVPAQLPADVGAFTGRAAELAGLTGLLPELDAGLDRGMVIAVIAGTAGVGKTALAVRWAHRVSDRFPDGQLFVDLRGYDPEQAMTAAEALGGFLSALAPTAGPVPGGLIERAARFRSEIAGRRMLILLDNAATVEQVRPLLPGAPGCLVLVTSRDSLAGLVARDGAHRLDLDLLPAADATVLLGRLVGARTAAEPEATIALAERCARLPLALRVAAELAVSRPAAGLAELVRELEDERRLDLLAAGGDQRAEVRTVFSWSLRQLPASGARMFRLLGLLPGPEVDAYGAAALADVAHGEARELLDLLARAHLLHPVGAARYGMHDLLRAYASDLATGDFPTGDLPARARGAGAATTETQVSAAHAALSRVFDYYLATAAAAMDRLHPGEVTRRPRVATAATPVPALPTPDAARRWLETERACLLAMAGHGAGHDWPGHTVQLSATLFRYFDGGDHTDAMTIHTAGLEAARRRGEASEEALALNFLGAVNLQACDYRAAAEHLGQALTLFARRGDRSGRARVLGNLGTLQERLADFPAAARYYEQSLPLFAQLGDRAGEAHILTRLGAVAHQLGRSDQAARHLGQALVRHRQAGHRFGEAWALTGLGDVEARLGRDGAAVQLLGRARSLFRELGDRAGEAWALTGAGDVDVKFGRHRSATEHHQQAGDLFREIGERDGEVAALNGLGEAALAGGRADDAVGHHRRALDIAGTVARDQQARAHAGLARALGESAEAERADEHCARAVALYAELGMPDGEALLRELSSRA